MPAAAIEAERIEAPPKDGVLMVRLPMAGRARLQGKRIQVRGGGTAAGAGRPAWAALVFATARRW